MMPGDSLWLVAVIAVETTAALVPVRRLAALGFVGFMLGYLVNELPFVAIAVLGATSVVTLVRGDLDTMDGVVVLGLAAITAAGLVVVARRGLLAGPAVADTLRSELGAQSIERSSGRWPSRSSLLRILVAPLPLWRRDVQRIANIIYGDAGRSHRLDLYRPRSQRRSGGGRVLVHFHGGYFRTGGKSREARPLMQRLASQGWLCVSANYRLGRHGRFPNALVDAKKVIAWVREYAHDQGIEPSLVVVAGSSAGAHLASMAALTANDPLLQPGFEQEDTAVDAAVCLYGYYGSRGQDGPRPSTPMAHLGPDAPPFFIAHGANDTLLAAATADRFADELRRVSTSPVVHVQLPGGQHSFDLFHSLRFERVVDGIEDFSAWVQDNQDDAATTATARDDEPDG